MRKSFIKVMFFGALAFATSTSFVGCKDYDDDINRLDKEISNVKDAIKSLEDKVGSGKYVESCVAITEGNGGYEIKFSDGQTVKIYNGAKGENGAPGAPGTPGAPGSAATDYVTSVTEGETAYDLVITYADGTKKVISMPKATTVLSGIKFIPTYLSGGEAARIHFPTIVTDSIAGEEIAKADWTTANYKTFKIVYSGKADLKYQVNPNSVSFSNMEVVGFVRDTAEIWNYSTNDKKWELFDAGQRFYKDGMGKLSIASYQEGHGMLNFRVKDWAFAEQANLDERTVYSLRIKNGDNIVHSDFIPAKHEVILQKNVHLVKIADSFDQTAAAGQVKNAIAPNTINYREFIADKYFRKIGFNPVGTEEAKLKAYQADKSKFENNEENQLYKGAGESKNDPERIVVELNYTGEGHTKELKDIVTAYFDKRAGRSETAQYPLMDNGFDDYSLVFEPVDFYYDGVNQTKRYLDVEADGTVTVKQTPDKIWGAETDGGDHTAAIDRTPIVRVKLVAPGYEDNANVVKTAIIKIHIVRKTVVPEINITETKDVTLMHINQNLDMDMDKIFNHKDVQMSKDEFRKTYEFHPEFITAADAKLHNAYTWDAKDNPDYSLNSIATHEYNQVFVTVKNTAFSRHDDHEVYTVKGVYKPNAANAGLPEINVTYTINVKYPTVVAPEKTKLNWVDGANYFVAHGRYDNFDTPKAYAMVAVLNDEFDLINYNPYKGQVTNKDWARATLSFELVDERNNASKVVGEDSGIRLYQGEDNKWYIALEATDAGRAWINAADAKDLTKIKMRAVVSFNEAIDGLYGTCNKNSNAINKYAKESYNNFACDTINMINDSKWTEDRHVSNYSGAAAPEQGRSTVVINEFEVAFITPMVFHANEAGPLHDKYQEAENTVSLKEAFFLSDYLWSTGAQEQFNNNHVIYDFKNKTGNTTLVQSGDDAGWSKKLVVTNNVFDVKRPVNFKVAKAYFADGIELDAENMKKIKLDNVKQTITWVNNGEDIANQFTIDVEVCVNHKWGGFCGHTWKANLGHSVGTIKILVKKHDEK